MNDNDLLAQEFEANRDHLQAVAYRMLGSFSEADDALQETWLRLSRSDAASIDNLGGWLTTVVARVCLNMLRSRRTRREESISTHVPDPIVSRDEELDPEAEAITADSVGLALLIVLENLAPAERLAFVLHDMFAVPFDEIATIVDRSPDAARQLASRARRRVQGAATVPDADLHRQRAIVDAFFAAARGGDFEALVALLDPDIVVRSDGGTARPALSRSAQGAASVARQVIAFARPTFHPHPALVNGAAGAVSTLHGKPFSVMGFTVVHGKIVAIDILADPDRLAQLDLAFVDE